MTGDTSTRTPARRRPVKAAAQLLGVTALLVIAGLVVTYYLTSPTPQLGSWHPVEAVQAGDTQMVIAVRVPCSMELKEIDVRRDPREGGLWMGAHLDRGGIVPWPVPLIGQECHGRVPHSNFEYETVLVELGEPLGRVGINGCGAQAENPGCTTVVEPPAGGWPEPTRTAREP